MFHMAEMVGPHHGVAARGYFQAEVVFREEEVPQVVVAADFQEEAGGLVEEGPEVPGNIL